MRETLLDWESIAGLLCVEYKVRRRDLSSISRLQFNILYGRQHRSGRSKIQTAYEYRKFSFAMNTIVFCIVLQGFALLSTTISPANSAGLAELLDVNGIEEASMAGEHVIVTNSLKELALEDNSVGTPCHVEYKVTKLEVGRCVKLSRGIRACASDTYLDPFHPECM